METTFFLCLSCFCSTFTYFESKSFGACGATAQTKFTVFITPYVPFIIGAELVLVLVQCTSTHAQKYDNLVTSSCGTKISEASGIWVW